MALVGEYIMEQEALDEAIARNPKEWQTLVKNQDKFVNYLMGQVMKVNNRLPPTDVRRILKEKINE